MSTEVKTVVETCTDGSWPQYYLLDGDFSHLDRSENLDDHTYMRIIQSEEIKAGDIPDLRAKLGVYIKFIVVMGGN